MPRSGSETQAFLDLALERFQLAAEAEAANRRASLDDLEFSIGEQWPSNIRAQRQLDMRPCLTMNRLPQFIRQVTNEQRQQRPAIQVNPIGDGADVDTAEILQGIVRHIEVNSKAEETYDNGFESMVRIGFGYMRLITDWIAPETEDQEIYIAPIDNSFTVYLDPTNKRDPAWGFIVEDLLAEEFKSQFPESKYAAGSASLTEYESVGDTAANWVQTVDGNPAIRIAEYFWIEKSKGDKGRQKRQVHWSKISALDILDERDWPGNYIPIIPIYGEDINVNGKRHLSGLVRYAKDPQRAYNFWVSAATERIALAPKAPWLLNPEQIEGYEKMWEQSNNRNMAYLPYKAVVSGGQPLPPPTRNVVEPGVDGMEKLLQLAVLDMQATTGLNDANLGRAKPDESGKAVLARQKQGDVATLNYSDNMARAINNLGRQIIDLIPKVYSGPRVQRIIKPDETVSQVGIYNSKNDSQQEAEHAFMSNPAVKKVYDIGVGRYDVAVSVGPSYQSKRQEAVASQLALVQAAPQVLPIIGDLIVRNMDWPGANEIADRMKKMLPPQLQDSDDQTPEAQLMQAQQQLAALGQQHGQLVQVVQQQKQMIDTKQIENQARVNIAQMQELSKQAIVKMQEATKIAVAQINASKDANQSFAENEIAEYKIMHDAAHDVAMQGQQQEHEQQMAQQTAQQGQQEQQSDQAHDLGMAAVSGQQADNQQANQQAQETE